MKLVLLAVILPTVVLAAPQKRVFFNEFVGSVFDQQTLKCDVQMLLDNLGSDVTEQACEAECHLLIKEGHLFDYGCPLVCHSLQTLANYFHETPDPSADPSNPCPGLGK